MPQISWSIQDLADALGRSSAWVKKWRKRLQQAAPDDDAVLQSQPCAPHTPPPRLAQVVVDHILDIRDDPPQGLNRIPMSSPRLTYLVANRCFAHSLTASENGVRGGYDVGTQGV
jgi:hypothetical protein